MTEWHRRPDEQAIIADLQRGQLGDGGHIHQRVDGCVAALFEVQQQIGSPGDRAGRAGRGGQPCQGFFHIGWTEVFLPEVHGISVLRNARMCVARGDNWIVWLGDLRWY